MIYLTILLHFCLACLFTSCQSYKDDNIIEEFVISNINAGGWTLAQNALQTIKMGNDDTTVGIGGSLASSGNGDTVHIICSVANTNFVVISSMGNINVT